MTNFVNSKLVKNISDAVVNYTNSEIIISSKL